MLTGAENELTNETKRLCSTHTLTRIYAGSQNKQHSIEWWRKRQRVCVCERRNQRLLVAHSSRLDYMIYAYRTHTPISSPKYSMYFLCRWNAHASIVRSLVHSPHSVCRSDWIGCLCWHVLLLNLNVPNHRWCHNSGHVCVSIWMLFSNEIYVRVFMANAAYRSAVYITFSNVQPNSTTAFSYWNKFGFLLIMRIQWRRWWWRSGKHEPKMQITSSALLRICKWKNKFKKIVFEEEENESVLVTRINIRYFRTPQNSMPQELRSTVAILIFCISVFFIQCCQFIQIRIQTTILSLIEMRGKL